MSCDFIMLLSVYANFIFISCNWVQCTFCSFINVFSTHINSMKRCMYVIISNDSKTNKVKSFN